MSARAREALERIAALYAIEKTIRSRSAGERRTDRQEKSNGRGRTKQGYFWAIARDDRAWCGTGPPAVAYTYAPGRGAVHALKLLDHYRGIVQCDGYAAYKTIANTTRDEAITLAFCWAHLRRRFFEIAQGGPAPIANEALERIAMSVEAAGRGIPAPRQACGR